MAASAALCTPASAETITFDDLVANTSYNPLVTQGFVFSGAQIQYTWLNGQNAKNGSNNLIWGWSGSVLNVSRTDNAAFNLNSLDLGTSYYAPTTGTAQLNADLAGGGSFNTALALSDQFQTFHLGLNNVLAVHIHGVGGTSSAYTALDNVSVSAVPEPESYALLLAGLGLLGTVVRRRKSKPLPR